jgi:hypothetical protein
MQRGACVPDRVTVKTAPQVRGNLRRKGDKGFWFMHLHRGEERVWVGDKMGEREKKGGR